MTKYLDLLGNENCRAFLALIRRCEGANYNTLFGGGTFSGWADHPRQKITRPLGGRAITSSAAGAYQFLARTWDDCKAATGLPDFSPASQDLGALWLINRREALQDVVAGNWRAAIGKCNKEWASLPGSPYGQPTRSMDYCLAFLARSLAAPQAPAMRLAAADAGAAAPEQPGPAASVVSLVSRLFALPDFLKALKAGEELAKPATWKRAQVWTGSLTALLGALFAIARAYGYPTPIDETQIAGLVSGLAVAVGLFQSWATVATTRRIGLPPGAGPDDPGAADRGGYAEVPGRPEEWLRGLDDRAARELPDLDRFRS